MNALKICKKSHINIGWVLVIALLTTISQADAMIHSERQIVKEAVPLQMEERCALEYKLALELSNKGDTNKARQILLDILKNYPKYHAARIQLVQLYLKQEKEVEARAILEEGLKIDSGYAEFIKLNASIEEQSGNVEAALRILMHMPPERKNDLEYVAWLGLLYQKAGHYDLSKKYYTTLIEMEPHKAAWWLGLSLALESIGNKKEALKAYQRVYAIGGLDPTILEYVSDRITLLSSKRSSLSRR